MSSNASGVVVFGHYFNEKLEMYAHSEWENLNVVPSRVIVHFKGVSYGTFRQFCSEEFTECLMSPRVKYMICKQVEMIWIRRSGRKQPFPQSFCPMMSFCIMVLTLTRSP